MLCMDLHEIWKGLEGLMVGKEGNMRARQIPEGWACHSVQPWKVICLHSASVSHLLMGRSDSSPPRKAQIVIICTLLNADPDT